jgi:CRP-like cAMP-binding protein
MTNPKPNLLNGLDPVQAAEVLALGKRVLLASGEQLFRLGEPAEALYIIQRGRIRLTLPMQVRGSDEEVLVEERSPGQVVGWSALTPPCRFTMTATAPLETEVLSLSGDALRSYFEGYPTAGQVVAFNLAAVIGERLQLFQAMWLREMQRTVELRCA